MFEGDDYPEPDDEGGLGSLRCHGNTFTNNFVYDCTSDSIKVNGADSNVFLANVFAGSSLKMRFEKGTNNLVVGNLLPADALVKLVGASTNRNSLAFKEQPRVALQLDSYSTATFTDDTCAIFDSGQSSLATRVTTQGSSVTLTAAQIGDGATVSMRNFLVSPNTAEALVRVPLWEVSGELRKRWTSQVTSPTARLRFTVGDLSSNHSYGILRNGQVLASVVSSNSTTVDADSRGPDSETRRHFAARLTVNTAQIGWSADSHARVD